MKLDEFKEFLKEYFKRSDYIHDGKRWHVKQLCFCRYKVLNEPYEAVASKERVLVGQLIHKAIDRIIGYQGESYVKKVGDYEVVGTPDLIIGDKLIEIKFTTKVPKEPRMHDSMQLRLYMWLLDKDVGYLWYISPDEWREFEIRGKMSDKEVIYHIENPRMPMWSWECRTCSLYPCEVRFRKINI